MTKRFLPRLGLCCKFRDEPIRFRTATARIVGRLERAAALEKLSGLCMANAQALMQALRYCAAHGIGAFRVNSQMLPLRTHPEVGYRVDDLPAARQIVAALRECGSFARARDLRLSFHPDQFILLSSHSRDITAASLAELERQAELAAWVGADVINIHAGGGYGDKRRALERLRRALARLSGGVRARLTLENDDRVYTPADLLPLCRAEDVPLVYDLHHHRCLPDGAGVVETTEQAIATWTREPLFHLSSPRDGWGNPHPRYHHDFVSPRDFPPEWLHREITIEVEAKAKEVAVARLARYLRTLSRDNAAVLHATPGHVSAASRARAACRPRRRSSCPPRRATPAGGA